MRKSTRSTAIEFWQNIEAITAWRDAALTDRERLRLVHPLSNLRRWRKETAPPAQASGCDVAKAAAAHWQKFVVCVQAMPADQAAPFLAQAAAFLDEYAWPFLAGILPIPFPTAFCGKKPKPKNSRNSRFNWSERRDLNSGPPVPQTGALTGLRYAPIGIEL